MCIKLSKCPFPCNRLVSQRGTAVGQGGNTGFLIQTGVFLMPWRVFKKETAVNGRNLGLHAQA